VQPDGFLAGKRNDFPNSFSEAFLHVRSECSLSSGRSQRSQEL